MKTKLIAIVMAILFSVSSWGQEYMGSKTVTSAGNVDLSEWIVPTGQLNQIYLLKIVPEKVDPQLVKGGVNAWVAPTRTFPDNYPDYVALIYSQWAPSSLPGSYGIYGDNGSVSYVVNYISWPEIWVNGTKMGNITHNGTQFSYASGITSEMFNVEQSGGYVEFILNSNDPIEVRLNNWFTYTGSNLGVNRLWSYIVTSGWTADRIGQNQSSYVLPSQSGWYTVGTGDGGSTSAPGNYVPFSVRYATPTPTVTSVSVSPSSASVEKGQTKQFTAQVAGTNNPAQTVTWTVEGGTSSTITSSGLLSVGSGETAGALVVRATSTVDPSKSGTANVTVTTIGTGIEEVENVAFQVYLNPVQSVLLITSALPVRQVTVYTLSGNKVLEKSGDIRDMEISQLCSGLYIVRIYLENGKILSRKIVKY